VHGPGARHAVAYARTGGLAVIVPRLVARPDRVWPGTTVELPGGGWADVLTGDRTDGGSVSVAALLRRFPVAVLGRE
jgi:(1->4)-alpha-D-glucan 1-alpha-D-glucosylmutase